MGRGQQLLEVFRIVLAVVWWGALGLIPVQVIPSFVRAVAGIEEAGWGNLGATVMLLDPTRGVGLAYGTVELADLPVGPAAVVALSWLLTIAAWLPALRQLRRIVGLMPAQPFEHGVVRRMQLVGPLVAMAGVATSVLDSVSSWVTADALALPGAQPAITASVALAALAAGAVLALFAEVLRMGTRLRENDDFTI